MRRILFALCCLLFASPALAGGSTAPGFVQSGIIVAGHCAQVSAPNVIIDSGVATCGAGAAGVSQGQGTAGQVLVNGDAAAHTGALTISLPGTITANITFAGTVSASGLVTGTQVSCLGLTSGNVIVLSASACGGTSGFPITIGSTSVASGSTTTTIAGLTLTAPTLTTPALGTPASGVATNLTGLPIATGISGLGTGVAAGLANAVTGSGAPVLATNPTLVTPAIGAATGTTLNLSGNLTTNITGGGTQCVQASNTGVLSGTAAACGSGGGGPTIAAGTGISVAGAGCTGAGTCTVTNTGAGSSGITLTDGTNSVTGATTVNVGNGFVVSGTTPNGTLNSILSDITKTTSYSVTAANMGGCLNLAGSTGTLTLAAASSTIFAPGMSLCVVVTASGNWTLTNSTGLTMTGLNSTTLPPGFSGTFVANANGTGIDFAAGIQFPTSSAIGGLLSSTCASHNFSTGVSTSGVISCAQPAVADISGFGTGVATALATNVSGSGAICLASGSACSGAGSSIVIGTTTVTGGTTSRILYDNGGVAGEYSLSGTGSVCMSSGSACSGGGAAVAGTILGLNPIWVSTTQLGAGSGTVYIESSTSNVACNPSNITPSSPTASTWYHVYINASCVLSASTTAPVAFSTPSGNARSKSGDTANRYLYSALTDASNHFYQFTFDPASNYQRYVGNLGAAPFLVLNGGTATTSTQVVATSCLPVTTSSGLFYINSFGSGQYSYFAVNPVTVSTTNYQAVTVSPETNVIQLPVDTGQSFTYIVGSGLTGIYVSCAGYNLVR